MAWLKRVGFALCLSCCTVPVLASVVTLEWDPNTEADMAGYRLFSSTVSLLGMTTAQAMAAPAITRKDLGLGTTNQYKLSAGTTFFVRLTAFNTSGLQSGFNVNQASAPDQVAIFVKPGDSNRDGKVGLADLSLLLRDFGTARPEADFNNDGAVGLNDLSRLLNNWGN